MLNASRPRAPNSAVERASYGAKDGKTAIFPMASAIYPTEEGDGAEREGQKEKKKIERDKEKGSTREKNVILRGGTCVYG